MENLDVMPATSKWSIAYLKQHTNEWPGMTVLKSAGGENRYLYYVPEQSDRDMAAFRGAPRRASANLTMSFAEFLKATREDPSSRYYLQAPLVMREADAGCKLQEHWSKGIDETLRADCDRDVDHRRLGAIQQRGGFGPWSRSQLFVGPADSLSPVHYDQYDNIYLQVSGEKHFLLFDPRASEGLCPFPVSHPYDEYAMVDLERVDARTFPRAPEVLAGRGAAATLRPGDSLYIPTHWWHHVQAGASPEAWSVSVNFWFAIHEALTHPRYPLPLHLELELARHTELLLSDVAGSNTGRVVELLLEDAEGGVREPAGDASLPARNFVLFRLARILGPRGVSAFLREFLPPARFQRSAVLAALAGPARPGREGLA